jgi:PcfJ-like protein
VYPRRRRNPEFGQHPDLFEKTPTKRFVPLEDLSTDQIRALPRAAFSPTEWESLDEDDQEAIYEGDPESVKRINEFVYAFVQKYEWSTSPDRFDYSSAEEYFEEFLRLHAGKELIRIADRAGYDATELIDETVGLGYTREQAEKALIEALQDQNNYEFQYDTSESGRAFFKDRVTESFYMDNSEVGNLVEELNSKTVRGSLRRAMFPDEIERALAEVEKRTGDMNGSGIDLSVDDVIYTNKPKHVWAKYIEVHDVVSQYIDADPDWDKITESVKQELAYEDPLGPLKGEPPPEERVLYRWPDGFYVQDLTPQELSAEGKVMGMCVGRPEMGYGKAVRDKEIKILSLRRPSGKPLFTFEAALNDMGEIIDCSQIAGKANRNPGFDLGKDGPNEPIKKDEVERVIDFVIELGLDPPADCVNKEGHPSLGPALNWIIVHQGDDLWARKMVEKVKTPSSYAASYFAQTNPSRHRRNPPACAVGHTSGCTGFCLPYRRRR